MKYTAKQLREEYQAFFESKGHVRIPSASLFPENDPTVLFNTAGMQPLVPYLLGEEHPAGKRIVDVQKCVRTGDIEEVGDVTHHTFFEMLGNWSLGDYFKKEAIEWAHEFLTQRLGIPMERLSVTVFEGDEDAPRDEEAASVWKSLGYPDARIGFLSKKDNWWAAGPTGPCGPDTEIFYWRDESESPEYFDPSDDRWVEIWNNVFMQFNRKADGTLEPLKNQNIDTGMGLERTVAVLNGYTDNYKTDAFWSIIEKIQEISGRQYNESQQVTRSMRIIADHAKAAVMMMGDQKGIAPSNIDQGYVIRMLVRRAIRQGRNIGMTEPFMEDIAEVVFEIMGEAYLEIIARKDFVLVEIQKEELKFRETLEKGLKEFEKIQLDEIVTGAEAFRLFSTYGFPIELTVELANERGARVDLESYNEEFKKHQDISRQGAEQKFKGGLADQSVESTRLHTATHLLHKALKIVLGGEVNQKGSNITPDRLRFDFNYPDKMTDEQKAQVEKIVNDAILADYPVFTQEMAVEEAKQGGAIGLFEDRYGDKVKVYSIGDFSTEICGGPHVQRTGELQGFKILKEESCGAGLRRIKAQVDANLNNA